MLYSYPTLSVSHLRALRDILAQKVFGILPVEEAKGDKSFTVYADGSYKAEMPINYKIALAKRPVLLLEKDVQARANHYLDALKDIKDKSVIKNLGGISLLPDGVVIDRIEKAFPEDSKGEGWYWTVACVLKLRPSSEEDAIVVQGAGVQIDIASTGNIMRLHSTVLPIMQPKKAKRFNLLDALKIRTHLDLPPITTNDNTLLSRSVTPTTETTTTNLNEFYASPDFYGYNPDKACYAAYKQTTDGKVAAGEDGVIDLSSLSALKEPKKEELGDDEKDAFMTIKIISEIDNENKIPGKALITFKRTYRVITGKKGAAADAIENLGKVDRYDFFDTKEFNELYTKGDIPYDDGIEKVESLKYYTLPNSRDGVGPILLEDYDKSSYKNSSELDKKGKLKFWNFYNVTVKYDYELEIVENFTLGDGLKWTLENFDCNALIMNIPHEIFHTTPVTGNIIRPILIAHYIITKITEMYPKEILPNARIKLNISKLYIELAIRSSSLASIVNKYNLTIEAAGDEFDQEPLLFLIGTLLPTIRELTNENFKQEAKGDTAAAGHTTSINYPDKSLLGNLLITFCNPECFGRDNNTRNGFNWKTILSKNSNYIEDPTDIRANATEILVHEAGHHLGLRFTHGTGNNYEYDNKGLSSNQRGKIYPVIRNTINAIEEPKNRTNLKRI